MSKKLIRFDWAMKKLLRHKANYDILEGFLTELLLFDVKIESILESEGNKESQYDKFNKVDILIRSQAGELMLVEMQNESEVDYFQRMLYGVSKLVTEYIKEAEAYGTIKRIYSINIIYFGLGQGKDYVYEYKGEFVGFHYQDILQLSNLQKERYKVEKVSDIFPRHYILKVNNFDDVAKNSLDEWIYFFKNSEVRDEFQAKGLKEVKEKLLYEHLSEAEKQQYQRAVENRRIEKSVTETAILEGLEKGEKIGLEKGLETGEKIGLEKGKELGLQEGELKTKIAGISKALLRGKLTLEEIAEDFEVSVDFIRKIQSANNEQ